jgi:DNA invertase Pin-like site-specific DNA recombinase/transposase
MLGDAATSTLVDGDAHNTPLHRYVAYYRVSTQQQLRFGFSLEAQRESVARYIGANRGKLIAEYAETNSGRKDTRPKLTEALYLCSVFRATLLIARLDRLSRNVATIARLIESKVDFVAVDFPHANRFTLHILAAIAEHESRLLSERVKAAVAAIRARGEDWKLCRAPARRHFTKSAIARSAQVRRERAKLRVRDLAPLVWDALSQGKSCSTIAAEFNRRGVRPPANTPWGAQAVGRLARKSRSAFAPATAARRTKVATMRQARLLLLFGEIKSMLLQWWREGMDCVEMATELNRLEVHSPQGAGWNSCTVARYLRRALNVTTLCDPLLFDRVEPQLLEWKRKNMSCAAMAAELNRLEIRSPKGKSWNPCTVWRYLKRALNVTTLSDPFSFEKIKSRLLAWNQRGMSCREMAAELDRLGIRSPKDKSWKSVSTVCRYLKRALNVVTLRNPIIFEKVKPRLLAWKRNGMSCAEIAAELDRLEIRSPRGRRWNTSTIWRYLQCALGVPRHRRDRKHRRRNARQ